MLRQKRHTTHKTVGHARPSRHCACTCRRHGRGFRRATCGPLLRVAGNASSLESLPRRSVPQTAFCTSRQALLWSASRDRALVCSGSPSYRFVLGAAVKLCLSAYDTRSRSCPRCVWLCASWSVGTSRHRHVLIDRPVIMSGGACCCWQSHSCSRKPAPGTSSAASGRCSRIVPSRGLEKVFVLIPSCSCHSCHKK